MEFMEDMIGFLKMRKKMWLAPMIIILLIFGFLLMISGTSALAPFIYTLF
jgi:hypothetical protein